MYILDFLRVVQDLVIEIFGKELLHIFVWERWVLLSDGLKICLLDDPSNSRSHEMELVSSGQNFGLCIYTIQYSGDRRDDL